MKPKLSVIIIAKNVADEIIPAIKSAKFADEIVVVDNDSTDDTVKIALRHKAVVAHCSGRDFSKLRNTGKEASSGDWLLYLDSDERIPVRLAKEIQKTIADPKFNSYTISRYEIFLGKHLTHWPDPRVHRLMKKDALKRWVGDLHEQPIIEGEIGNLREQMVHLSHKNIDEKVPNTMNWSRLEAKMLFDAGHPPMAGWRFLRIMLSEFIDRCIRQGLWKDGTEGWIEIIYQMFSRFLTYERLWEMQRKPSLKETYSKLDKQILDEWEKQTKR